MVRPQFGEEESSRKNKSRGLDKDGVSIYV
jgi:hypothetical protein